MQFSARALSELSLSQLPIPETVYPCQAAAVRASVPRGGETSTYALVYSCQEVAALPLGIVGAHHPEAKSTEGASRAMAMLSAESLMTGLTSSAARSIGRISASQGGIAGDYVSVVASARYMGRCGYVRCVVLVMLCCEVTTTTQEVLAVTTAACSTLDVTTEIESALEVDGSTRPDLVVTTETQATSEASAI
jgi:hypothetical protein